MADFRILDKDLSRLANAEQAGLQSFRPMLRFGVALIFIATMAILAAAMIGGGHPEQAILVAGIAVATLLALAIGANDVSNSLGPVVGAGAIGLMSGLVLVGIMQVGGAVFAGAEVTERLSAGIVATVPGSTSGTTMMVAALMAASIWISLATWADAPVSTTHSVVGAIMGAGIATSGWKAVNWFSMIEITAGWIVSPLFAGALAAGLLALFRALVYDRHDPLMAARQWLPWMIAMMVGLFILPLIYSVIGWDFLTSMTLALAVSAMAGIHARITITQQIAQQAKRNEALKAIFRLPLVCSALLMGFAHGSNDAANVIAPLQSIFSSAGGLDLELIGWAPLMAGLGISAGALLFGRRLVHMVGSKITRLNANRAFCVSLATAITVLAASAFGLPVSTTHVAVGGVFGVGFYREWRDNQLARIRAPLPAEERRRRHLVRRSHMRTIFGAWLITVPAAALMAAGFALLLG